MSRIVSIDYFQKAEQGQGVFATPAELSAASNRGWVRTYEYPRGLVAFGAALASFKKTYVRPVTAGVAKLAYNSKEALYDGLVGALEVTGCIPTGKTEFGLIGETLSEYKVRCIQKRNELAMQLKRDAENGQSALTRAEIVSQLDDITRVLDRVSAVQSARKGW
jgi:hypothetical protein